MAVIRSEFFLALNQVATERGISPDSVLDSIKTAVLAAYQKDYGKKDLNEDEEENLEVKLDQDSGAMHILKDKQDITPPGFGRIAAQTARQVILQQIREAEKKTIIAHYTDKVGTIIKGRAIRFEGRHVSFDIGKTEGILPIEEQIRNENYRLNNTFSLYIKEIKDDHFGNSRIILSRAHPKLVEELFAKEVPEINSGTVKIFKVAREAGERSKIAVHSDQTGVDPVGACVGQKGIRVKSVTDELGGNEKIDIIQYNEEDELFVREALSPATVTSVRLDKEKKRATVSVDEEQAPLAIGKNGVNVNLASRLTGYEIDIVQTEGKKKEKQNPEDKMSEIGVSEGGEPAKDLTEESKEEVPDSSDENPSKEPKEHVKNKAEETKK